MTEYGIEKFRRRVNLKGGFTFSTVGGGLDVKQRLICMKLSKEELAGLKDDVKIDCVRRQSLANEHKRLEELFAAPSESRGSREAGSVEEQTELIAETEENADERTAETMEKQAEAAEIEAQEEVEKVERPSIVEMLAAFIAKEEDLEEMLRAFRTMNIALYRMIDGMHRKICCVDEYVVLCLIVTNNEVLLWNRGGWTF